MKTEIQTMQEQVNTITAKIHNLDATIVRLEELIELLTAEAMISETRLEQAYEGLSEVTGQRAIEESKFQRANDELGLMLCKEMLPEPDEITDDLYESCTCDTYEWAKHTCPHMEDIHDDHVSVCVCCPCHKHQCYMDT